MESVNNNGISALLVDDHKLIVLGLKAILTNSEFNFKNIESATTGKDALTLVKKQDFDIYIIDIELPDINGFDLIEAIREIRPKAHIIVNTIHDELAFFRKIETYHVDAVVCKSLDTDAIKKAIQMVLDNSTYSCEPEVTHNEQEATHNEQEATHNEQDAPTPQENHLSKSEIKVLQLIAQGLSTTDISTKLFISVNTVETHRRHINEKLGTKNVAGMIVKGMKLGLLDI